MKESQHIEAVDCLFMGRYPLWYTECTRLTNCFCTASSQAAVWYASDIRMLDTVVEASGW